MHSFYVNNLSEIHQIIIIDSYLKNERALLKLYYSDWLTAAFIII